MKVKFLRQRWILSSLWCPKNLFSKNWSFEKFANVFLRIFLSPWIIKIESRHSTISISTEKQFRYDYILESIFINCPIQHWFLNSLHQSNLLSIRFQMTVLIQFSFFVRRKQEELEMLKTILFSVASKNSKPHPWNWLICFCQTKSLEKLIFLCIIYTYIWNVFRKNTQKTNEMRVKWNRHIFKMFLDVFSSGDGRVVQILLVMLVDPLNVKL